MHQAKEKFLGDQKGLRDQLQAKVAHLDQHQKALDLGIQKLTEEME